MTEATKCWILTGSPENYAVTRDQLEFRMIGLKSNRRSQAEQFTPGDRIIFYLTKIKAFTAIVTVESELFESRDPVWPGNPKNPDIYPWRLKTSPVIALPEGEYLAAEQFVEQLQHIKKWPIAHWTLAFQGQLRVISAADEKILTAEFVKAHQGPTPRIVK